MGAWAIPLLIRRDQLTTPQAGTIYGISVASAGLLAAAFGGRIGDRMLAAGRTGGRFTMVLYAFLIFVPGMLVLTLAKTPAFAALGLIIQFFGVCAAASVMYAVLQDITPNQYRGQAIAILSLLVTLGSATLGPTSVALITDRLFHDPAMVGYSILIVTLPCAVAGAILVWGGRKSYAAAHRELQIAAAATGP